MDAKKKVLSLLGSVDSVNMQTVTQTTLYVIPAEIVFVPHFILIRNISADLAGTVLTAGQSEALTDFLGAHTLTNINSVGAAVILRPVPATTPAAEIIQYTAAEIFQVDITTGATGAATATIEVWGTLDDA